jgi:hypothetical protein
MKSSILAIAAAIILTTPAYADKTPVKPIKPVQAEACENENLEWIVAYNLDQIEMAIKEIRRHTITPVKPKPRDNFKKAG